MEIRKNRSRVLLDYKINHNLIKKVFILIEIRSDLEPTLKEDFQLLSRDATNFKKLENSVLMDSQSMSSRDTLKA